MSLPNGAVVWTDYANTPDGALDLLWVPDGRHTAGQGYIGAEKDPSGGNFRVTRYTVHDGDVYSGGERCETLTPRIATPNGGGRIQAGFGLMLPNEFQTDSGGWNYVCQMHYPNAGPKQVNWAMSIRNGMDLWCRILGGPLTPDGTMGTQRVEEKVATLQKGVYHNLCFDLKFHLTTGMVDIWVDGEKKWEKRCSTLSPSADNSTYWKQGFYRSVDSFGTDTYFFKDTIMWRDNYPDRMLAYFGIAAPQPPIDVPGAIVDLTETLAWMTRTKATSGLGYSKARARSTHVYKALVKLGGTW